jgi:two-component system, NarL family, sensor kinase
LSIYFIFVPADATRYIIIGISAGISMFLFLSAIILLFVFEYRKRQRRHKEELLLTTVRFESQLLQSQLEIQEQTLNNISEEIHDNVGQILSLAKVQINIMNQSDQLSKNMLNEVKENIGKAMNDLRDIAKGLSTNRIKSMNIRDAITNEAERINRSGAIKVSISAQGEEKKMDEQKKLILFRIIQESLQNCIKHAEASEISVCFLFLPDTLQLAIKDNGKGFDLQKALKNNTGLGLMNLTTRVSLTGGTSSIESVLNEGTIISINIPYE